MIKIYFKVWLSSLLMLLLKVLFFAEPYAY